MLLLLFEVGRSRCAIEAARIVELLPLLALTELPGAPAGVAGMFSYHGAPVPALDLCELALGRRAPPRLSTRIALVRASGSLLGLVTERATQLSRRAPQELAAAAPLPPGSALPGRLLPDASGLIHWLDVDALLPAALRAQLSAGAPAAAGPR